MLKKFGLVTVLMSAVFALLMTGCGGSGGGSSGGYYDGTIYWVIYDDPFYDPWYDPYYDPYYCYSCYGEEGSLTQKDLVAMSAQKQAVLVGRSAEKIQMTLGLSAERSQQVAKLAFQMAKIPKGSVTQADMNNFSKELLGSSAQDLESAAKQASEGQSAKLDQLIDRAARVNGIGPEHARQIMKMFN